MTDPNLLRRMAQRLTTEPEYMAYLIERATQSGETAWGVVARRLGISEDAVVKLALCRRPRTDQMLSDLQDIAEYVGVNRAHLLRFVREVEALEAFRRQDSDSATWLIAARDKSDDD